MLRQDSATTEGSSKADSKIFLCPFNAYHKLPDYRKWQFHVGRCGDRRGKNVFRCNFNQSHMFTDPQRLVIHEQQ